MKLLKLFFFFQILFLFSVNTIYAQKTTKHDFFYAIDTLKAKKIETNIVFSKNREKEILWKLTQQYNVNFVLDTFIESKTAFHYLYNTFYKNYKIYNATLKISVLNNGKINSCFYNSYPIPTDTIFSTFFNFNKLNFISDSIQKISSEKVYFFTGEKTIPALKVNVLEKNWNNYELIINANNDIIYQKDCNLYNSSPIDSVVKAFVFFPDPLTSSKKNYGAPYNDQNDADVPEINAERKLVDINVTFNNDTFWLYNNVVKIAEFSAPNVGPIAATTLTTFNYTRAQNEFEDVNVFYHLTQYNKYLKSLNFTNLVNYQILADTHALNGQDNSMFSPASNPPQLFFGEGGVDDAEDADVIIHEYGHAISHSAAPYSNNGTERKTLDEANGDYFAASYSKNISNYKWYQVYSWDGHNEFWNGRFVTSNKSYANLSFPSIYVNTDIWSATLMQIENIIGRDVTHKILLESIYSYSNNISMADAAWLLVKADSSLNNGANYNYICPIIKERGFTNTCPLIESINNVKNNSNIKVLNTEGFTNNNECLYIQSKDEKITSAELFDTQGNKNYLQNIDANNYKLCGETLLKGIYFLKITSSQSILIQKIVK